MQSMKETKHDWEWYNVPVSSSVIFVNERLTDSEGIQSMTETKNDREWYNVPLPSSVIFANERRRLSQYFLLCLYLYPV